MNPKLTVGITTCFKSSITKINQMVCSLFNADMTTDAMGDYDENQMMKKVYSNDSNTLDTIKLISISQPVELVFILDGANDTVRNGISYMIDKLKTIYSTLILTVSLFISQTPNGVSSARNMIITAAHGEYVKFCDDDDLSVNINELLNIIDSSKPNSDYIECLMSNLTKNVKFPLYTGWYPTNVIVRTSFLNKHKLLFVQHVIGEDSIWRFDLYYQLQRSCANITILPMSIYLIYSKSFKTTAEDDEEKFDFMLETTFEHEKELFGKIPLNPLLFQILSILVYKCQFQIKVADYVLHHINDFEFSDILHQLVSIQKMTDNIWHGGDNSPAAMTDCQGLFNKYYETTSIDSEDYERFKQRFKYLRNARVNKHNDLRRLFDAFNEKYNKPWMFRLFLHMSKKNNIHVAFKSGVNTIYHKELENLNSQRLPRMLQCWKEEYDASNTAENKINTIEMKYSFVPCAILIWCFLDIHSFDLTAPKHHLTRSSSDYSIYSDESCNSSTDDEETITEQVEPITIPTATFSRVDKFNILFSVFMILFQIVLFVLWN